MCDEQHAVRRKPRQIAAQRFAGQQMDRNRVGGKCVEHDEVEVLRSRPQASAAHRRARSVHPARSSTRKRNMAGSRASRTTSGSISKKVQVSPACRWQARLPAPSPTTATLPSLPDAAARAALDRLRDRPAEIVIGQRLGPPGHRRPVQPRECVRRHGGWCRATAADACRSMVSTTRCTPKKLRVVSTRRSPGCHSAVMTKAHTASAAKRAGSRRCSSIRPTSVTSTTCSATAKAARYPEAGDVEQRRASGNDRERGRNAPQEVAHANRSARPAARAARR